MICPRCPDQVPMKVTNSRPNGVNGHGSRDWQMSQKVDQLVVSLRAREIEFRLRLHFCPNCRLRRTTIEMDAGLLADTWKSSTST